MAVTVTVPRIPPSGSLLLRLSLEEDGVAQYHSALRELPPRCCPVEAGGAHGDWPHSTHVAVFMGVKGSNARLDRQYDSRGHGREKKTWCNAQGTPSEHQTCRVTGIPSTTRPSDQHIGIGSERCNTHTQKEETRRQRPPTPSGSGWPECCPSPSRATRGCTHPARSSAS